MKAQLHKSRSVVNFYNHKGRWALHANYSKCSQVPSLIQRRICRRARSELRTHGARVVRLRSLLSALTAPVYPPHHDLWMCIHAGEGDWHDRDSGHNGHYGGLQMHPGWGYGTSYYASDDSQLVQEWAAERAYKASGYSSAWLWGQWGADASCFT